MSHYDCPCMEKCPLHHAMALIGGKWKVQILCAVTNAGAIRYNALRARLDGISNTVLASALRELELVVRGGARIELTAFTAKVGLVQGHSCNAAIDKLAKLL